MPSWFELLLASLIVLLILILLFRVLARQAAGGFLTRLFSDPYSENLLETLIASKRVSFQNIAEIELRAVDGKALARPIGPTTKFYPNFDQLLFAPAQLAKLSLPESSKIDMQVSLGPKAAKPLVLAMPLLISGMAYGLALSDKAKIALAKASRVLNTATNSGEGPFLPEEPLYAGKYVLQITRWPWGARTEEQIAYADMLEVQLGQGADTGSARFNPTAFAGRASALGGIPQGESPICFPAPPGVQRLEDWPNFMKNLRQRAKGIPVALKLMAGGNLEEDLAFAVDLGFDVIILDGAQGGSHGSTTIKQDDFGLPTLHALARGANYLKDQNISLIISGGFYTPGQCLKALALGADAVYLGTVPLFALGHHQLKKVFPWEPPSTLTFYDSKEKHKLDVDLAASSVVNVYKSMVAEMEEALIALGKSTLSELGPQDLIALDGATARLTGVRRF